jgi:hypothetical protein
MDKGRIEFKAKQNCKTCYGRGFIVRSFPIAGSKKAMRRQSTLCHCATEILPEKKESIVSDEEVVVPKVKKTEKTYASMAHPSKV